MLLIGLGSHLWNDLFPAETGSSDEHYGQGEEEQEEEKGYSCGVGVFSS